MVGVNSNIFCHEMKNILNLVIVIRELARNSYMGSTNYSQYKRKSMQ